MSAPREIHAAAAGQLEGRSAWTHSSGAGGLSPDRRQTFALRLDRCWPDLPTAVAEVHPDPEVSGALLTRLVAPRRAATPSGRTTCTSSTSAGCSTPDWLQQPRMFGYACYTDRFAGDLKGVAKQLDHLEELGVTYLHLMPLLQPREGDNDGGYAVQDYRAVRADLGTIDDLRDLATDAARPAGSAWCSTWSSTTSPASTTGRCGRGPASRRRYRDYFHVFPDRALPDAYERTLPEVFPDFAPGNFTWDDDLAAGCGPRSTSGSGTSTGPTPTCSPSSPTSSCCWPTSGVEVLRLDAIAFLWKRMGTTCQNQPEVHAITQALRAVARMAAPAVAFKAEAIVGPRDLVQYLGTGRHAGRVSDLAYHNSLMVQVWSMLATGNTVLARHALRRCRRRPSPAPGSPTSAATTTSAGRSTTATPRPSG